MELPVYNTAGEVIDRVSLDDRVFGVPPNIALMHQAVVQQDANARQGTASSKTRSDVSGGGRKPWRQKHTGRARQGSTRAPHWRGGGVVFGPHPRDYRQRMPKKARRLALRCALSSKVAADQLRLVEGLRFEVPRTKALAAVLNKLGVSSALLVLPDTDINIIKSARNLRGVKTLPSHSLNIGDVLRYEHLVMPLAAAHQVEHALAVEPTAEGQG